MIKWMVIILEEKIGAFSKGMHQLQSDWWDNSCVSHWAADHGNLHLVLA